MINVIILDIACSFVAKDPFESNFSFLKINLCMLLFSKLSL